MIKYKLQCVNEHVFEGWFRSSDDFDVQAAAGDLSCPVCGVSEVGKAIMAPAVVRGRGGRGERADAPPTGGKGREVGQAPPATAPVGAGARSGRC